MQTVKYFEKVNSFVGHFSNLFENTNRISETDSFPFAKVLGDVVLFGLNSIDKYSRYKNPFASNGKISKMQKQKLKQLFGM